MYIQGGITRDTIDLIDRELLNVSGEHIYVVIKTDGGDPNAGYRIIKMIQAKFKKISFVIPAECMSTGTLMALGSDEIFMRKGACLGPLDTRIKHPADGSWISSIDVRDTASTIAGLVDSAAITFNDTTNLVFELGKEAGANVSFEAATRLFCPIADKIDPYHLQASVRSATLGQKYAEELLESRMMSSRKKLASLVSNYLANRYSSHSYAITLDEASSLLALNVSDVVNLDLWEDIHKGYNDSIKSNNRCELIFIKQKVEKNPKKMTKNNKNPDGSKK